MWDCSSVAYACWWVCTMYEGAVQGKQERHVVSADCWLNSNYCLLRKVFVCVCGWVGWVGSTLWWQKREMSLSTCSCSILNSLIFLKTSFPMGEYIFISLSTVKLITVVHTKTRCHHENSHCKRKDPDAMGGRGEKNKIHKQGLESRAAVVKTQ